MDDSQAKPSYKNLRYYLESYGVPGTTDDRAVRVYAEVEAYQAVQSLRAELIAIKEGRYSEDAMNALLGKKRAVKYGSYEDWARLMLMWLAAPA